LAPDGHLTDPVCTGHPACIGDPASIRSFTVMCTYVYAKFGDDRL